MTRRNATYFSIITLLFSSLFVFMTHKLWGEAVLTSVAYMSLIILEILLIGRLVGSKNLHKIHAAHPIFYILLTSVTALIISLNVIAFVDTIFKNSLHILPHDNSFHVFCALIITVYINIVGNYWLFDSSHDLNKDTSLSLSQQLKKEAELYKLRQQVDPHFLFNSLNSIHALTHIDQGKASQMIFSLSQYFRNNIQKQDQDKITLREELADIRLYLSIELVRFGHRLDIVEDIDDNILDREIPPLLLQPLIENAIKYGIYGTADQVTIQISIHNHIKENGQERTDCLISNPYDPNTHINSGTGFGIAGIMRRLYLTYNRNDLLQIEKTKIDDTHMFKARLSIPHFSHNNSLNNDY